MAKNQPKKSSDSGIQRSPKTGQYQARASQKGSWFRPVATTRPSRPQPAPIPKSNTPPTSQK